MSNFTSVAWETKQLPNDMLQTFIESAERSVASGDERPNNFFTAADSSSRLFFFLNLFLFDATLKRAMNAKLKKIQYLGYVTPLLALLVLFYVWVTTSPITIGPSGILGVFVLLYLFWVSLFFIVIHLSFVVFKKTPLFRFFIKRREGRPFHWQLAYYVASIVA
ncbi:MAG: hypothetical protein ACR2KZ_21475, partial [Segetibacter sp.]